MLQLEGANVRRLMDDRFDETYILSLIAIIISSRSLQLWQNAWQLLSHQDLCNFGKTLTR